MRLTLPLALTLELRRNVGDPGETTNTVRARGGDAEMTYGPKMRSGVLRLRW